MSPEMHDRLARHVMADKEERELESIVSVLGERTAQAACTTHTLPELIAREQGHGLDFRSGL